jgi:hypothetical protein
MGARATPVTFKPRMVLPLQDGVIIIGADMFGHVRTCSEMFGLVGAVIAVRQVRQPRRPPRERTSAMDPAVAEKLARTHPTNGYIWLHLATSGYIWLAYASAEPHDAYEQALEGSSLEATTADTLKSLRAVIECIASQLGADDDRRVSNAAPCASDSPLTAAPPWISITDLDHGSRCRYLGRTGRAA